MPSADLLDPAFLDALEAPTLSALLACRGSLPKVAELAWPDSIADLDADGVYAVAEAALCVLTQTPEGYELAFTCALFGIAPSRYIGVTDPVLGFDFDRRLAALLQPSGTAEQHSDEAVSFTTGGPR